MKVWSRLVFLGVVLITLAGCLRDDDEPIAPTRPISRLYISTSNFSTNPEVEVIENVYIVDPADAEGFSTTAFRYRTGAIGGSAISYSPDAQLLFQSGLNVDVNFADNSVQVLSIDTLRGSLSPQGQVNNVLITSVRGIAYHPSSDLLFLANTRPAAQPIPPAINPPGISPTSVMATVGPTQSDVFVYRRPRARNQPALPNFRIPFTDKMVRAVFIHDISIQQNDRRNRIYFSTVSPENAQATIGEVLVYNDLPDRLLNSPDSVRRINPDFTLTIPTARSLTGMAYSPRLDLMVATEAPPASGAVQGQGRILIFENFSTHSANAQIAPDRIITGTQTRLTNAVSIAIDNRERGKYMYVADSGSGTVGGVVLRFLITNEGNVEPDGVLTIPNRVPVSISLDARGTIPVDTIATNGSSGGSARIGRR
ncbi:hypothetical protein M8998_09255 [Sphingobacterium sp. lm-10]|uniref:hypothetical protein n=1 Tax=Sphingobacterium sp. lm-10 TaxID=2944904 RepID=UPI0020205ECD|nr:hypothetical protein [Sphingobacterium sp. lm-10]MCL7988121.1 hypothetical protein [Sphingobacterium sp. lm-10]